MPEPEAQDIGSGDVATLRVEPDGTVIGPDGLSVGTVVGTATTGGAAPVDELLTPKQDSPEIQALKADLAAQVEWEEQLKNFITRWIGVVKDHKPEVGAVMEDEYVGLLGG